MRHLQFIESALTRVIEVGVCICWQVLATINNLVEGFVNTRASIIVMSTNVVCELGIMHLVIGMESYKTASRIITQVLGRINEIMVRVGEAL